MALLNRLLILLTFSYVIISMVLLLILECCRSVNAQGKEATSSFALVYSKDMRDQGSLALIAIDPFPIITPNHASKERIFIAVNDPNGGSILRVTGGEHQMWDDRIILDGDEEAIIETMDVIYYPSNMKSQKVQYSLIITVAPNIDKIGVRYRDQFISETTLTRKIIRIDIDETSMRRSAECELVYQGHGNNKHKEMLFDIEQNNPVLEIMTIGDTAFEYHKLDVRTMQTIRISYNLIYVSVATVFNAAKAKYSNAKVHGKYWLIYDDRSRANPFILLFSKDEAKSVNKLESLPTEAVTNVFRRIVGVYPIYEMPETYPSVIHVAYSGYDHDGFTSPGCVTTHILRNNVIEASVTCDFDNAFLTTAFHNGSISLVHEQNMHGMEQYATWNILKYDSDEIRIMWTTPPYRSLGMVDRSMIRKSAFSPTMGIITIKGKDVQGDTSYGHARFYNSISYLHDNHFTQSKMAYVSLADSVHQAFLLSSSPHRVKNETQEERQYEVMFVMKLGDISLIRIVHAHLTEYKNDQNTQMKMKYGERVLRARSVEFMFEHSNHLVYYLTRNLESLDTPKNETSVSLTIYSPSTQVYDTTTHEIPHPYPSKYLHSLKRERIYAFSLSERDSITIMEFSFDFTLLQTVHISLPSTMKIARIGTFVTFKDKREEIVLLIAEDYSRLPADVLLHINVIIGELVATTNLNNNGKVIQCGLVRDSTLLLVASPKKTTKECMIYSLNMKNSRGDLDTFHYKDLMGITDCRINSCFSDEFLQYLFLSTKSGLIQLDISSSAPRVTSIQLIPKDFSTAIIDSYNGRGLFFFRNEIIDQIQKQYASTIFAFDIPVYRINRLSRIFNLQLLLAVLVPIVFLCALVPLLICLVIQTRKLKRKAKAASDMEQMLLDNQYYNGEIESDETKKWLIDIQDIKFESRISEGASGVVLRAKWKNIPVAVKKMKIESEDNTSFIHEATTLINLRHIHVLLFLGICVHDNHRFIVTELLDMGSLDKYLQGRYQLPFSEKIRILSEVASAMIYLHSLQPCLIHRDLKPQNILLDKHLNAKVGDFGLSKTYAGNGNMTGYIGTFQYMAPEILDSRNDYDMSSDVYSFAMIMYEVLFESVPFLREHCSIYTLGGDILQGRRPKIDFVTSNPHDQNIVFDQDMLSEWCSTHKIPEKIAIRYTRLMVDCWQTNQNLRPSFQKVYRWAAVYLPTASFCRILTSPTRTQTNSTRQVMIVELLLLVLLICTGVYVLSLDPVQKKKPLPSPGLTNNNHGKDKPLPKTPTTTHSDEQQQSHLVKNRNSSSEHPHLLHSFPKENKYADKGPLPPTPTSPTNNNK